jgi:hypothetical protein
MSFSGTRLRKEEIIGKAPLLPKLRGHFAEFLRESYLAPLGILYQPTCVGFGYRFILVLSILVYFLCRSSFSRKYDISCFLILR